MISCQKIISLVKSTKASTTQALGAGFKIVTRDVEDMLNIDSPTSATGEANKFVLSSTCTLENLTSYKLDPPCGNFQYALVSITGKAENVFIVDQVQLVDSKDVAAAKVSLTQLLRLAVRINQKDLKRNLPWDDHTSPIQAKRCKKMGRFPTGPPIEDEVH